LSGTQQGVSYQLYKDNVAAGSALLGTGGAATFSGTFNTAGTYTARSVATGAYVEAKMAGERTVAVVATPATPGISPPTLSVCQGTDVVFRVTSPVGGVTYSWLGTAGTVSGTGNGTYTVSGSSTGTKSVTAYARLASNGITCQSANAATVTATVNALPVINTPPQLQTLCGTGMQLSLSVTAAAGSGSISSYQWKKGATNVGTNSNTYTETVTGDATYTVVVTNSNNCSLTSNPATISVQPAGRIGAGDTCSADMPGRIGR
jgi:hypothetical protein